jgi:TonB family protein
MFASAPREAQAQASPADDERPIEIQALVDELQKPEEKTKEEQRREEQKQREEEDKNAHGQVVDIPRPAIEARPDDARYLAEYDARVAHETRGAVGKDRAGARVPAAGGAAARIAEKRAEAERATAPPGLPGPRAMRRAGDRQEALAMREAPSGGLGQDGSVDRVGPDGTSRRAGASGTPAAGGHRAPRARQGGSGGNAPDDRLGMGEEGGGGRNEPKLQPSEEMLNRAIERGTGSPDYLRDVDDGESTALNAKKFKFATFFNRVKRAVAEEWHADFVYSRHDPTGNVYGGKDRITVVRVHLRPNGELQSVTLLDTSGVSFLDDEAMDAFRRAAPFVNPPPQLIEGDGLIHFNMAFILDLTGHSNVKLFRYR